MKKKCEHGRQKSQCKDCGGVGICKHIRRKNRCIECKGSQICEHRKQRSKCKDCGGSEICKHSRRKSMCRECGGASICEHRRYKNNCKECGSGKRFQRGNFTVDQIKEMGAIKTCQFPNCLVQSNERLLSSDHFHDGHKINQNNYRGEICAGHNRLLADLDAHPEWANQEAQEYMKRRPYKLCVKMF